MPDQFDLELPEPVEPADPDQGDLFDNDDD